MKQIKRIMNLIFVCILAISLSLTGIPYSAMVIKVKAESVKSGTISEGLTWQYDSDGTLTISGNGSMPDYTTVNNYYTGITTDTPWRDYLSDITKVVISGNINNIGKCAFSDCPSMKQILFSSSVKEIGESAFARCTGLNGISFPNGLVSIGDDAFRGCTGITNVIIPDSVTTIGSGAFQACTKLTNIHLGENISSIKSHTFSSCTKLTNIEMPQNITSIGIYAFSLCSSILELDIPISVNSISDEAFSGCSSLKKVTVNNDSLYFGQRVFNNCSSNFVLYGNSGSTSETYAEKNAHAFVAMNAESSLLKISSFVIDKESGQKMGTKINLSVKASGGTAPYKYLFYYKKSNESEKIIQSYSNANNIDYTLGEAGIYVFGVRVKDEKNTIIEHEISNYRVIGFTNFVGGNGTAENPYRISDVSMFCEMKNYNDAHFILINNLDLSDVPRIDEFNGVFDGNGNTVTVGLSAKNGLFNSIVEGSEVKNLIVNIGSNKILPDKEYGVVAIRNEGKIVNCHVKGSIAVNKYQIGYRLFGGIAAYNIEPGIIERCRDSISVNLTDIATNEAFWWGGIAGNSISGKITKCLIENDFNITIRPTTSGYQTRIGSIAGVFGYSNISECAINTNVSIAHLSYTSNYCLAYGVFAGDEWYTYDHGLSLASELNGIASCYIPDDFLLSVNFQYYGSGGGLNSKSRIYTKDNIKNVKTMSSDKITQWYESLVDDYKPIEINPLDITSFKVSGTTVGKNVRLDAMITGGTGQYSITFSYILNGIETVLSNNTLLMYDLFVPTEEGKYDFIVSVKDSNGEVVTKTIEGYLISKCDVTVNNTDNISLSLEMDDKNYTFSNGMMYANGKAVTEISAMLSVKNESETDIADVCVDLLVSEGFKFKSGNIEDRLVIDNIPGNTSVYKMITISYEDFYSYYRLRSFTSFTCYLDAWIDGDEDRSVMESFDVGYIFQYDEDNFSFINTGKDVFYDSKTEKLKYYISDEAKSYLTIPNYIDIEGALELFNLFDWGGSCYGMSSNVSALYGGFINSEQFGANSTHDLYVPCKNTKLRDCINIMQFSQLTAGYIVGHAGIKTQKTKRKSLVEEVEAIQANGILPVIRFSRKSEHYVHAIMAFDIEHYGNNYEIKIMDPNKIIPSIIYIADDYSYAEYEGQEININEVDGAKWLNIESYAPGLVSGMQSMQKLRSIDSKEVSYMELLVDTDSGLIIEDSNGHTASITGTTMDNCTFDSVDVNPFMVTDDLTVTQIIIYEGDPDVRYTIRNFNNSVARTLYLNKNGEIATVYVPESYQTVYFSNDGEVHLENGEKKESIVARYSAKLIDGADLYSTTVMGEVEDFTLQTQNGTLQILSDDKNNIAVTVKGKTEDTTYSFSATDITNERGEMIIDADSIGKITGSDNTDTSPDTPSTPSTDMTSRPNIPKIPDKGTTLKSKNVTYKVTKKGSEVAYIKTSSAAASVTIPVTVKINGITYKVTAIASNAFKGNKWLSKVTINKNITSIGKNAFSGCKILKTITIKSTKLKSIGKNAFKGIKSNAKIKVPSKKLKAYKKLLKGKGQGKKVKITK